MRLPSFVPLDIAANVLLLAAWLFAGQFILYSCSSEQAEVRLENATAKDLRSIEEPHRVRYVTIMNSPDLEFKECVDALTRMTSLETLIVVQCELRDEDIELLAGSGISPRTLNVSGNRLTDASLPVLATMGSVRRLFIGNSIVDTTGNSGITNKGLAALEHSDLEFLSVNGLRNVSDECINVLTAMPSLKEVDASRTALTSEGVTRLRESIDLVRWEGTTS